MNIIQMYSHMGGAEWIDGQGRAAWTDIENAIDAIIPDEVRNKVSRERGRVGRVLYSPTAMNAAIEEYLNARGWASITEDPEMLEEVDGSRGSKRKIDFCNGRVGVEVQFGKYAFIAYDFVKFLAFYEEQRIDVGVEIMVMRSLSRQMSSGVGSWESAMQVLKTRPRGHPPMPLVLVGIGIEIEE